MTTKELIAEVSQTVLAVLIVAGGGVAILTSNPHLDVIIPFMGVVIGFYFGKAISPPTATSTITTNTPAGSIVSGTRANAGESSTGTTTTTTGPA